MGTLADLYSYIDAKKRVVKDAMQNPTDAINQMVARIKEDQSDRVNLYDNAYPMAGDRTVLNSPAQKAVLRDRAAQDAANMAMAAATVWHGSPHKFDKFDSSKIGSGEGMQAYGHGLYLAETPEVAKGYQTKLSQMTNLVDGLVTRDLQSSVVGNQLKQFGGDAEKTKQYFLAKAAENERNGKFYKPALQQAEQYKSYANAVDEFTGKTFENNTGSLYKVDLPDEHIAKMLDWDKPLSQQPANVKEAWSSLGKEWGIPENQAEMIGNTMNRAMLEKEMQKRGVPGVRYLDGGSRGAGAGSSNFVVFPGNEDMLQILERNGVPSKGFAEGGAVPGEITDQQIRDYLAQGHSQEEINAAQQQYGVSQDRVDAQAQALLVAQQTGNPDAERQQAIEAFRAQVAANPELLRDGVFKPHTEGGNEDLTGLTPEQAIAQYMGMRPNHNQSDTDAGTTATPADARWGLDDASLTNYLNADWHPGVQDQGGFLDKTWRAVRPVAALAAMAYGGSALAGMGSGAAAAATPASGLAGSLGMNAGMGATALNTGALNTGMNLVRGQNIGQALKGGATSALLSPVGTMAGNAATSALGNAGLSPEMLKAIGTTASGTAVGGANALVSGRPVGRGLTDGLVNGLVASAGNYAGGQAARETGSQFAGTAANSLTQSTLKGLPPGATIDSLATQYASGKLSVISGLPPDVASIVVNLAKAKKPSARGALTSLGSAGLRRVVKI